MAVLLAAVLLAALFVAMADDPMANGKYALSARMIHWLTTIGFVFMWACGYAMEEIVEDDSSLQDFLVGLHISVGVTLLALLALRIAVRLTIRPPSLPAAISAIEQTGARLGHAALYALPLAIIAAGWAKNDLGGDGVEWFGIAMPKLLATVEGTAGEVFEDWARDIHMWLAYLMLAVAVAHVAAVGKHRWIDRHDILGRMTIGRH